MPRGVQWVKDSIKESLRESLPSEWELEDVGDDILVKVQIESGYAYYWVWVASADPLRRPAYNRGRRV
jgi:hypothetical protein